MKPGEPISSSHLIFQQKDPFDSLQFLIVITFTKQDTLKGFQIHSRV